MLAGEHTAGLAESGGDLVEDQQRAVLVACLADRRPEPRRRQIGHGAYRLGNDRGDVTLLLEDVADHVGAHHAAGLEVGRAVEVFEAVRATVAVERCHVLGTRQQRANGPGAKGRLAADAGTAEAGAVERVPKRHGLEPPGRGACNLERDVDRVRARRREQHLGQRLGRELDELTGEGDGRLRSEAARRKRQLVELALDRLARRGWP